MRQRCLNSNSAKWKNYGGRGITICDRWSDFDAFYNDMGPRPTPKHEVDRLDNDGNYEPGNVAWRTKDKQLNNTRANLKLTYHGETLNMGQWARRLGMHKRTLSARLKKGWSLERAMEEPIRVMVNNLHIPPLAA